MLQRRLTKTGAAARKRGLLKSAPALAILLFLRALTTRGEVTETNTAPAAPSFIVDRHWGSGEEGLPENVVMSLAQTRDGFLWTGTLNGLARFDGEQFNVFLPGNTPQLKSTAITCLVEDSKSNLWIGTDGGGVTVVSDRTIQHLPIAEGPAAGRLTSMCEDSTGSMWLYTANGVLSLYRNGHIETMAVPANTPNSCRVVIAEPKGLVWVGTDWGMIGLNPSAISSLTNVPVAQMVRVNERLDFLLASRSGGFWRLADGRVQKWRDGRMIQDLAPYAWSADTRVACACEDREGNLIVGTSGPPKNEGVFWYAADGSCAHITSANGLSHDGVLSLCVDQEDNLWVGTDGRGLNRVKRRTFDITPKTADWVVLSAAADGRNSIWMGVHAWRACHWDGMNMRTYAEGLITEKEEAQGLNPSVGAVFVDRDQQVWVGLSPAVGTRLFQFRDGRFHPAPGAEIINADVSAIFQDRAGILWVGTRAGLARWDGQAWKWYTTADGLSAPSVTALADDAAGNLWIGTHNGGLNRLTDGKFTAFREKPGELPSDNISSLLLDREGVLWIGTDWSGLVRYDGSRWTRYSTAEGLASDSIGYLMDDPEDNLWLGSTAGLMRVPRKSLDDFAAGRTASVACRAYGRADGLLTGECTSGAQPAACRTPDGKLCFPTIQGLVTVNPGDLVPNTNPPPVIIDSIKIEDVEQLTNSLRPAALQTVTLPPGRRRLDIHFTSLDLGAPDRVHFKYRLDPHEAGWILGRGNSGLAHYGKLPAGNYQFRVMAGNEDDIWNETGSTLAIVVLPPFWQTWWFITGTSLALLGLIIGSVYYVSTQRLQRQVAQLQQQEALERERGRIARDLHDQLGANLTQVALLGEMAGDDRDNPAEVQSHAEQICQTARETTRSLDEIVWAVNPSNDTLDGLVNYACKYAQEYLELAGIRYRIEAPAKLPEAAIAPDVRHNVFLAFKETVNNVVRHAQATEARIRVRIAPASFTLEVEDNGRGIATMNEKAAQSRNGLRNMRKRMTDVHGEFSIEPAAERGTIVRLTAPLRRA